VAAVTAIAAALPGAARGQPVGCSADAVAVLTRAAADADAGDGEAAADALREANAREPGCATLSTASWSWHAWLDAPRASATGGSADSLASVRAALAVLEPDGQPPPLEAAYAAAVVHAAAAAAQHERAEMQVWLEHAEGLAVRLPPEATAWPLPFALAEGELWLVVDDHDLAEAAFARALGRRTSAAALRGIARSRSRRGDMAGACSPFRQALALVEVERPAGPLAVEARAFLRLCP
jgi:hypothetical protein